MGDCGAQRHHQALQGHHDLDAQHALALRLRPHLRSQGRQGGTSGHLNYRRSLGGEEGGGIGQAGEWGRAWGKGGLVHSLGAAARGSSLQRAPPCRPLAR